MGFTDYRFPNDSTSPERQKAGSARGKCTKEIRQAFGLPDD
jgi:hypothetical protein